MSAGSLLEDFSPSAHARIHSLSLINKLNLKKKFLFKDFIYLLERETEKEHMSGEEGGAEGEADSPPNREPDAALEPRILGS